LDGSGGDRGEIERAELTLQREVHMHVT
jgi:hypothetical protein